MRLKQVLKKDVLDSWDVCRSQVLASNTSSEPFTWCTLSSIRRGMVMMEEHLSPCSVPAMDMKTSLFVYIYVSVLVTTRLCCLCVCRVRHTHHREFKGCFSSSFSSSKTVYTKCPFKIILCIYPRKLCDDGSQGLSF